jgi:SAM-dependent methyltransferase
VPSLEWNRWWPQDLRKFRENSTEATYGIQWGDPSVRGWRYLVQRLLYPSYGPGPLYKVVDRYICPYVEASSTVLEIGAGGGRWTRYLLAADRIICVDLNPEFFEVLKTKFRGAKLEFYQPQDCELDGIADNSVDFVFTFGTFVHIEPKGIAQYLVDIRRVLRPAGVAVVHYAEKTKPAACGNPTFSDMTAEKMVAMAPMPIIIHDIRLLKHSNIVVFKKENSPYGASNRAHVAGGNSSERRAAGCGEPR